MAWKLRMVPWQRYQQYMRGRRGWGIGWCVEVPVLLESGEPQRVHAFTLEHLLSDEYREHGLGVRPPLLVVLPCGCAWHVDMRTSPANGGRGWLVTGTAPDITVTPSVNCVHDEYRRGYHGWVRNGILSNDLEGRRYPRSLRQ